MCACVCTTFLHVHFAQSCSSPEKTWWKAHDHNVKNTAYKTGTAH